MDPLDVTSGLKRLDQIAEEEYGNDLVKSIAVADEQMSVRRLARITGIELKRPFATPRKIEGASETGASQEWTFNDELLIPDAAGTLPLVRLKGNPAYETQLQVYEELQRQHDLQVEPLDFGTFLQQAHSESNWFLSMLRAAQPYLCDESREKSASPPLLEKQKRLWELVSVAADDLATRAVEVSIDRGSRSLLVDSFSCRRSASGRGGFFPIFGPLCEEGLLQGQDPGRDHPDSVMARPELEPQSMIDFESHSPAMWVLKE
jgi:hypothetical protein